MNMELDDLPPRYRAQAEQQLAARKRRAADPLAEAVKQAKAAGRDFDSRGEYEFYTGIVLPKMARGEIVECEQHPAFPLFPAGEYGTMKLRPIRYTADFRLKYADGTVEIVEIKSKFVRRMQRDYPVRRRVFLEQIARPAGWKFTEIITAEDKDDLKRCFSDFHIDTQSSPAPRTTFARPFGCRKSRIRTGFFPKRLLQTPAPSILRAAPQHTNSNSRHTARRCKPA